MTNSQKERIVSMRGEGAGYKAIAAKLSLSVDTVKSFCRRHGLDGAAVRITDDACRQCGKPLERKTDQKKFCSDKCRSAWWSSHTNLYQQKEENKRVCAHCGRVFYSFQSKRRKFCGHPCFISSYFGGGEHHDAGAV